MSSMRSVYNVFGTLAATAILTGCGSGGSQVVPLGAQQSASRSKFQTALPGLPSTLAFGGVSKTLQPSHQQSWMEPDAKKHTLLYVADYGNNVVDVFSYPKGKLVGSLAIDGGSEGVCVDKQNDVWITAVHPQEIFEYAHGGTNPIATLSDPGGYPVGCAVNIRNGNLAVANITDPSGYNGNLAIFKKSKGTPAIYSDSNFANMYFVGYDDMGNAFVDGEANGFEFVYAELPKGGNSLVDISLGQSFKYAGGVQWDGTYMTVGDAANAGSHSPVIYQTSGGTIVGSTTLSDAYRVLGYFIDKRKGIVVAPEVPQDLNGDVKYFSYPAGGYSIKTIQVPSGYYGYPEPISVVVSK
jgi:hypothetical protein